MISDSVTYHVCARARLNQEKSRTPLVSQKSGQKGKGKAPAKQKNKKHLSASSSGIKKNIKCFFCKVKGQLWKECTKFKEWLIKKGINISFISYESCLVNIPHSARGVDSGSSIHMATSLQDF